MEEIKAPHNPYAKQMAFVIIFYSLKKHSDYE
jgi:hypothetical protein